MNNALAAISAFLPTIIKSFGFSKPRSPLVLEVIDFVCPVLANALAQLLTVPPYAVAVVIMVGFSYYSDKWQQRGLFAAASSLLGGSGYL